MPFATLQSVHAQPPGTLPDMNTLRGDGDGIAPDAFFLLDETGTPVIMHRMSFEEIDRLQRLDQGVRGADQRATLQRMDLTGTVDRDRAEFELKCRFVIDPRAARETSNEPIVLNLGLEGLNLLKPAEIRLVKNPDPQIANETTTRWLNQAFVRVVDPSDLSRDNEATSTMPSAGGESNSSRSTTGLGYQLVLPADLAMADAPLDCFCFLTMSTKVRRIGPRSSFLPLSLPVVPTQVNVSILPMEDEWDVVADQPPTLILAEVVGTGREVLRPIETKQLDNSGSSSGQSNQAPMPAGRRFEIDSQGGEFALKWKWLPTLTRTSRLLETESIADVRWESPGDPPTMRVQMTIRNLRGPLDSVEIELPDDAVLLGSPEISVDGVATRDSSEPKSSSERGDGASVTTDSGWQVRLPPTDMQKTPETEKGAADRVGDRRIRLTTNREDSMTAASKLEVRLQLRFNTSEASAGAPWSLRLPRVIDAIGQRGSVTVRTAEDHRLRWRPRLGVEATTAEVTDLSIGERAQSFAFLRDNFDLPVWLSGKQRQQRFQIDSELNVAEQLVRLIMNIRSSGSGIDPKDLQLDLAGWRLLHLTTDESDEELDVSITDGTVQWQADASDGKWPNQFIVTLETSLSEPAVDRSLELLLPRLISADPSSVISEAIVSIAETGQRQWFVDLARSPNLQRATEEASSRFRLLSTEIPWRLTGNFAERPLHLTVSGNTSMGSQGNQWLTRTSWNLTSEFDLQGVLKFAVPEPKSMDTTWTAVVDGVPALVRSSELQSDKDAVSIGSPTFPSAPGINESTLVDEDTGFYEIVTPRLATGTYQIELSCRSALSDQWMPSISGKNDPDKILPLETSGSKTNAASDGPSPDSTNQTQLLATIPRPIADQLTVESDYVVTIPRAMADARGQFWQVSMADKQFLLGLMKNDLAELTPPDRLVNQWALKAIPDFPLSLQFRIATVREESVRVSRALIRSLVGQETRHEHILAIVEGGRKITIDLPDRLKSIRVETRIDGQLVPFSRIRSGLEIDLPEPTSSSRFLNDSNTPAIRHLLDIRLWAESTSNPWWTGVRPLMRLPLGSAQIDWQLTVPTNEHLYWASSSSGRLMRWERNQLRLSRRPLADDSELLAWVTEPFDAAKGTDASGTTTPWKDSLANAAFAVPGNRYLFYSSDPFAFQALLISRTLMWLAVGGLVLFMAASTHLFPRSRHPMVVLSLAIALLGVLILAPDGVILTAQLIMISLVLIAVFYAISALVSPAAGDRVLQNTSVSVRRDGAVPNGGMQNGSTRGNQAADASPPDSRSENGRLERPLSERGSGNPSSHAPARRRLDVGQDAEGNNLTASQSPDTLP